MGLDERLQRLGVLAVPAAMFLSDGLCVVVGITVEGVDQVAVGFGKIRIQRNRLSIRRDCLIEQSFLVERNGEIVVSL